MPHDFRVILGFQGPDNVARVAAELGMVSIYHGEARARPATPDDDPDDCALGFLDDVWPDVLAKLKQAYLATLTDLDASVVFVPDTHPDASPDAHVTLHGRTNTRCEPFDISVFFDADEVGDEPGDCAIGVALDGRYRNVLLDIEAPYSSSTRNLGALERRISLARHRLGEQFPVLRNAQLIIKAVFT